MHLVLGSSMLLMGYVLDDLIILLTTPVGIVAAFLIVIFFEQSTAKSIVKDWDTANIKNVIIHQSAKLSYVKCKIEKFIGLGRAKKYC